MAIYIVKAGDSLSKIARDVVGDMSLADDIAAINNIANPDLIYPGQQLLLPDSPAVTKTASRNGWVLPVLLVLAAGGAYWAYKDNMHKKVAKVFNDHFRRTRKKK